MVSDSDWLSCNNNGCLYSIMIPGLRGIFDMAKDEKNKKFELPILLCPKCFQKMMWRED